MESKESSQPRPLYLITHPRVASNLLVKILSINNQPNVLTNDMAGGYFFLPAFIKAEQAKLHTKTSDQWTQEEDQSLQSACQSGFDRLQALVERSQSEDKILFVKEHANIMANPVASSHYAWRNRNDKPTNEQSPWRLQVPSTYGSPPLYSPMNDTLLPDAFLSQFQPTFLIRHPALVFPSCYRTQIDNEGRAAAAAKRESLDISMTFRWSRRLYDLYDSVLSQSPSSSNPSPSPKPLILDASDIIHSPHTLLPHLCTLLSLSPAHLSYTWSPASSTERERLSAIAGPLTARFLSTIWASEGIMREKAPDPETMDLDKEAEGWRVEFGEEEGRRMEGWVKGAMEDYLYLRERRVRPEDVETDAEADKQGTVVVDTVEEGVVVVEGPETKHQVSAAGLVGRCVYLFKIVGGRFWGLLDRVRRYIVQRK